MAKRQIRPPITLMLRPAKAARRCERVDVRRMYSRQLEARETYVAATYRRVAA